MSDQPRVAKVLAALLTSMTIGAIALMALSGKPPTAGAFSLYTYIGLDRLDPIEEVVRSRVRQQMDRWNHIEIFCRGAESIEDSALLAGHSAEQDINCHFVVGGRGQVLATAKWQKQWAITANRAWQGTSQTIRICIIVDGRGAPLSDYQTKRAYELVGRLRQNFAVQPRSISLPQNWL